MKVLCLFRQNEHSWNDFLSTPQTSAEDIFLLCTEHDQYFPLLWGTRAAIRPYFTKIWTGQEYHKQKRGDRFLLEIRISFCLIHSQGTQLPKANWQAPEKQNEPQKSSTWGGGGGVEEGGVVTTRLSFSVIKKSLEGWMRTGRLTYALIREH